MKYLVIDTYALCYRAHYGYPNLTNFKGEPTSVIVGFFKQFLSRVHGVEDYYPVFVADTPGSANPRKQLFPEYKANRTAMEPSFYEQVDFVVELGKMIGTVYTKEGYEADDLAGAFVEQFVAGNDITLLTVDADWLQLLQKNVKVIQLKTNGRHIVWDDALFFAENKIAPKQLLSLKALVGDGSDNIPGVPGIGNTTGIELLREFDSVDDIYANIIKVTNRRKIQEKLIANQDVVMRNKELVKLNTNVGDLPVPSTVITDEIVDKFIDMFQERTDSQELTNLLGVYLQRRKPS
jgi:DNA polymerase-1